MKRALALVLVLFLASVAWAGIRLVPAHTYDFACAAAGSATQVLFSDGTTSYLVAVSPLEEVKICLDAQCDGGAGGRRLPANSLIELDFKSVDGGYGLACISDGGTGLLSLTQAVHF